MRLRCNCVSLYIGVVVKSYWSKLGGVDCEFMSLDVNGFNGSDLVNYRKLVILFLLDDLFDWRLIGGRPAYKDLDQRFSMI